jgi:hypothetical protein
VAARVAAAVTVSPPVGLGVGVRDVAVGAVVALGVGVAGVLLAAGETALAASVGSGVPVPAPGVSVAVGAAIGGLSIRPVSDSTEKLPTVTTFASPSRST